MDSKRLSIADVLGISIPTRYSAKILAAFLQHDAMACIIIAGWSRYHTKTGATEKQYE